MADQTYSCPVLRRCGGCQWLDVPYARQLERKQHGVEELFAPYVEGDATVVTSSGTPTVDPIIGMPDPRGYRTKILAPFAPARRKGKREWARRTAPSRGSHRTDLVHDDSIEHGLFAQGTHRIVPIASCLVEDRRARPIIETIAKLMSSFHYEPYDEDEGTGLVRHVMVRTSRATDEVMVTLVLTQRDLPGKNAFVKELRRRHPEISTIVINVNPRVGNTVLGTVEVNAFGRGFIEDRLLGCSFKISSTAFFQTNPEQTERLYAAALEMAQLDGTQRVLDAYCGTGTVGILAAPESAAVVGVEVNEQAVRDAKANARRNGADNARFIAADATEWMQDAAAGKERFDVLFMDPPRCGSTPDFLAGVVALSPQRVVYISCNPTTQRRDVGRLIDGGYHLARIQPVDMFPHTEHVETVVLMTKCGFQGE